MTNDKKLMLLAGVLALGMLAGCSSASAASAASGMAGSMPAASEVEEVSSEVRVLPGEEGVVPGIVEKNEGVEYIRADVRQPLTLDFTPTAEDVIFNLAAVHRTPGHPDEAYFETNILGAEHVTAFAERYGIRYTGAMIENYGDDTEAPPPRQRNIRQFQ